MKSVSSLLRQKGFTLIEMMIVLMIISILLMIAVPSMTKSNEVVKSKSCEATMKLVQSQVAAYNAANETTLQGDLTPLLTDKYVDTLQCQLGHPMSRFL